MDDDAKHLQSLLERVVGCIGDPAPQVYQRLFARQPDLLPRFAADTSGFARAEMFMRAVEALEGLAAGQAWAPGLIASERANHMMGGLDAGHFDLYFQLIGEVFRDALGAAWTAHDQALWSRVMGAAAAAR